MGCGDGGGVDDGVDGDVPLVDDVGEALLLGERDAEAVEGLEQLRVDLVEAVELGLALGAE